MPDEDKTFSGSFEFDDVRRTHSIHRFVPSYTVSRFGRYVECLTMYYDNILLAKI